MTARVAIVLATAGRAGLVPQALADYRAQTHPVETIVLSVPNRDSLPAGDLGENVRVVERIDGLSAQRNSGIAAAGDVDFVFFFDDDSVVRADYVEEAVRVFDADPQVVGMTGRVLLDGATTGEIPVDTALAALAASVGDGRREHRRTRELYGCNFGYRLAADPTLRFDEALPLYSWLEDHDFARRLMRSGSLAEADASVIVHRGAKSGGRQAHTRLGYSQFMNPVHFVRSGSFPLWLAAWEVFRPCAKNVLRSVAGPERSWRRERLRGNLLALRDVLAGRITPGRITEL